MKGRNKLADRKFSGSHPAHAHAQEQAYGHMHDIHEGHSYRSSDVPAPVSHVVTATPVHQEPSGRMMGRATATSGVSSLTMGFYEDAPGRMHHQGDPRRDGHGQRGEHLHHYAQDSPSRLSLTDMHGAKGTSGKDPRRMDSEHFQDLLREGYSTGLALALSENASRYDFRFWVVDNSGSMQIGDGHRLVSKDGKQKAVACTRWEEIKETVKYHAQMASVLDCPTIFQLLNDPGMRTVPQKFSVCEHGQKYAQAEVTKGIEILRKVSPSGVTPLTQHIWDIVEHISAMASELRRNGKIVAIILATDGLPTDDQGYGGEDITDEFIRALRSLEGLPVWTVIRLCTDEEDVKEFYNSLDNQLEISIEVLDDYRGEAREVYKQNPWITYALPLHRCRELGYHDRLFDLIDERPLTAGEARSFCCFILGVPENELPDPGEDAAAFLKTVKTMLEKEQLQWNPIKKKMTPWILTKDLKKSFSGRNCVIM